MGRLDSGIRGSLTYAARAVLMSAIRRRPGQLGSFRRPRSTRGSQLVAGAIGLRNENSRGHGRRHSAGHSISRSTAVWSSSATNVLAAGSLARHQAAAASICGCAPAGQSEPGSVPLAAAGAEPGNDAAGRDAFAAVHFGLAGANGIVEALTISIVSSSSSSTTAGTTSPPSRQIDGLVGKQPTAPRPPSEVQRHQEKPYLVRFELSRPAGATEPPCCCVSFPSRRPENGWRWALDGASVRPIIPP